LQCGQFQVLSSGLLILMLIYCVTLDTVEFYIYTHTSLGSLVGLITHFHDSVLFYCLDFKWHTTNFFLNLKLNFLKFNLEYIKLVKQRLVTFVSFLFPKILGTYLKLSIITKYKYYFAKEDNFLKNVVNLLLLNIYP